MLSVNLNKFLDQGHRLELWTKPRRVKTFDDENWICATIDKEKKWFTVEDTNDVMCARSYSLAQCIVSAICYLNTKAKAPLSVLWWRHDPDLLLNEFLQAGHVLVLYPQDWKKLSNDEHHWMRLRYEGGKYSIDHEGASDKHNPEFDHLDDALTYVNDKGFPVNFKREN